MSSFEEAVKQDLGPDLLSVGFVCTTKNILTKNLGNCYRVMNSEGIIACLDGTWRLLINGWPLLIFGTDLVKLGKENSEGDSHTFVPFGFCFCRAETEREGKCGVNKWYFKCV